jgi:hypothetical protein
MRLTADAVFYNEVLRELAVPDPLGGETPADKQLRESSAKYDASRLAQKELITADWDQRPAAPKRKRKVHRNG